MDGINAYRTQPTFTLTILDKLDETRLKFSQGSVTVL